MAKSILIVDDDQNLRQLLRLHLSAAGYDITSASDGIEAGYAVLKSPPDLIITDIGMPNMDGYEFIAALKADSTLPPIPVIVLTSMDESDRGKELGVAGYISKPVRADKLLATVAECMPGGAGPLR